MNPDRWGAFVAAQSRVDQGQAYVRARVLDVSARLSRGEPACRPAEVRSLDDGVAELYVYDYIDWLGVDPAVVGPMIRSTKASEWRVYINSPGGDAFGGTAITNALRSSGVPVTTIVDGLAASAAATIFSAGSVRVMQPGTRVMIHNPWGGSAGDAEFHRSYADLLDAVAEDIRDLLGLAMDADDDAIREMMDAETWMSVSEAMALGFATDTSEASDSATESAQDRIRQAAGAVNLSTIYRHVPADVLEALERDDPGADPQPSPADDSPDPERAARAAEQAARLRAALAAKR